MQALLGFIFTSKEMRMRYPNTEPTKNTGKKACGLPFTGFAASVLGAGLITIIGYSCFAKRR